MAVEEQLAEIVSDQIGCDPEEVRGSMVLGADLGCDEVDVLEVLLMTEEAYAMEYGVLSDDPGAPTVNSTFDDLVAFAKDHGAADE